MQVDGSQPVSLTSNPDAEDTIVVEGVSLKVDPQRQFKARITERLIGLGSTILSDYADPATDYDPFQPKRRPAAEHIEAKSSDAAVVSAVAKLNKAAQRAFGAVGDFLRYDYSEEFGPLRKRCILEVTRNDGLKRVYSTKSEFARKSEAKTKVASIAIENGAIDFIIYGDEPKSKGYALAPVNIPAHPIEEELVISDAAIKRPEASEPPEDATLNRTPTEEKDPLGHIAQIDQCCQEWRAGRIQPVYYFTSDSRSSDHGCALKINLTDHISRAYSVLPTYKNPEAAQAAVAKLALEQDVLDFIQHGDGQQDPLPQSAEYNLPENLAAAAATVAATDTKENEKRKRRHREKINPELLASKIMTVANFFDSLPQPLPEPVGVKTAEDTNPVAWLNGMLQRSRGSLLSVSYTWTIDAKLGLHGCVMRIQQGSDTNRSYLVEPLFAKRQDAKIAACLEGISQGVSQWVRNISVPAEDKLTREMRDRAKDVLIPAINASLQRLNPPQRPEWMFIPQRHMFGCALTVTLDATTSRKYSVPPEYRTRNDAKFAVALLAVEQGALEFIRFRDANPPTDYNRDTYEASWPQVPRRPYNQPSFGTGVQPPHDNMMRKGRYPPPDHLSGMRPNLSYNSRGGSQRLTGYNTAQRTHAGERWSGHVPNGSYDPRASHDYSVDRNQWDAYYNPAYPHASYDHERHPPSGNGMESGGSYYPTAYHDLDYPEPTERDVSQAYQYPYSRQPDNEAPSGYYAIGRQRPPSLAHASLIPVSNEPLLDYSGDDHYGGRYSSRAPDPSTGVSLGADDARYGSRSHSGSRRASPARMSVDPPPQVIESHNHLSTFDFGHQSQAYQSQPLAGTSSNTSGSHPQVAKGRWDRPIPTGPRSNQPQRRVVVSNASSSISKEKRPPSQLKASEGGDVNETALRELAKASRKRSFSSVSSGPQSSESPARQWKKRPKTENMDRSDPVSTPETLVELHDSSTLRVNVEASKPAQQHQEPIIAQLVSFCAMHNEPPPQFHSELKAGASASGAQEHKVWIVVGKERMELPTTFPSSSVGQEKLAKLVLSRLMKKHGSSSG